jgi:hypothetical protein
VEHIEGVSHFGQRTVDIGQRQRREESEFPPRSRKLRQCFADRARQVAGIGVIAMMHPGDRQRVHHRACHAKFRHFGAHDLGRVAPAERS